MKIAIRAVQIIVGVLFVLSGLIKANDPQGLSFKMQEFFEIWNTDLASGGFFASKALIGMFGFLNEHSLFLSITMITLEIITGVALLLGWRKKLILWLLLVLMMFFTFLTAYAYLSVNPDGSAKFTNCGCFGDCLPLQPKTSFYKDIALLIMIVFLIAGQKYIQPWLKQRTSNLILMASLILSLLLQWYVLRNLPLADCLPFKKGNNLALKMKPPPNAIPSVYETRLVYANAKTGELKDMSQDQFNTSKIWEDPAWKWKETKTKLVKKGNDEPEIKGFSLTGPEALDSTSGSITRPDSTNVVLGKPVATLGFGLDGAGTSWLPEMKELEETARRLQIPLYFTANNPAYFQKLFAANGIGVPVFSTDFTIIRTAARTNPAFYLLKGGTVEEKYSHHQIANLIRHLKAGQKK